MVKQRQNHRWIEPTIDSEGRKVCLIPTCNNIARQFKNGNYRKYCKEHNCYDMMPFVNWPSLRDKVLKRDNNTCVKCGDDRRNITVTRTRTMGYEIVNGKYDFDKPKVREVEESTNNLIADHIKPIALGGDEWDMENIQTLCNDCNKIKTKQDQADIGKLRRQEKLIESGQQMLTPILDRVRNGPTNDT